MRARTGAGNEKRPHGVMSDSYSGSDAAATLAGQSSRRSPPLWKSTPRAILPNWSKLGGGRDKTGTAAVNIGARYGTETRGGRIPRQGQDHRKVPRQGLQGPGLGWPRPGPARELAGGDGRQRLRPRVRDQRGQAEGQ